MKVASVIVVLPSLGLSSAGESTHGVARGLSNLERALQTGGRPGEEGTLFTMPDCPGKCMTLSASGSIKLDNCTVGTEIMYWSLQYNCGGDKSFFKIRNENTNLCISDPDDCAKCDIDVGLVDCQSEEAAWFSYGNLHNGRGKDSFLYSARCWLDEGLVAALSTPSSTAKTCPEDFSKGHCEHLEWNLDQFSKDVLYYEWSFNLVEQECSGSLFNDEL